MTRALTLNKGAWVSVKKRLPRKGQRVLLWCGELKSQPKIHIAYRRDEYWGGFCSTRTGGGYFIPNVTHWMPMIRGPR